MRVVYAGNIAVDKNSRVQRAIECCVVHWEDFFEYFRIFDRFWVRLCSAEATSSRHRVLRTPLVSHNAEQVTSSPHVERQMIWSNNEALSRLACAERSRSPSTFQINQLRFSINLIAFRDAEWPCSICVFWNYFYIVANFRCFRRSLCWFESLFKTKYL